MTIIRRINVSQLEGNDANATDVNEIRPFGETAVYLDTNGPISKLVLMMFDGVRTHLKSKVLSPGVLFGSNADSSDVTGADTIKLIPDATLYDQGSEQYLVVDPTFPNHIHLRAGGTIDSSNASLYIGGENSHLNIPSGSNPPVYIRSNGYQWIFDTDGSLTFNDGTVQTTAWAGGRVVDAPVSSIGTTGDLAGDIAFSSGYLYYCTQNYATTTFNVTALGSTGVTVWVSSADYVGDLVANFTANSTGWTYNGVTIVDVQVDNIYGPGYALTGNTGFGVINGTAYTLVSPNLPNIWKRIAWSADTW